MDNCPSLKCLYSILGVTKDSSSTEIRTAYRQLAKRWHPDKCSNAKDDAKEEAKLVFQRVQHAYTVLSDEKKRLVYDAGLHEVVERDPSLQDLMGELANLMARIPSTDPPRAKASKCPQSREVDEYEELQKLYMNMVHADNDHAQDCPDFDVAFPGAENSTSATAQLRRATSWSPSAKNTFPDRQPFSISTDSVNTGRKLSNEDGHDQCQSPKPHANLFKGVDYDCNYGMNYDLSYDSSDDMCTTSPHDYDGLSPSSPKPHASLYTGDHHHEFASSAPAGFSFEFDHSGSRFAQSNFAAMPPSRCSTAARDDHERTPSQLSCEGFCMGASDDIPDKAHYPRVNGRHSKVRRKRCKDKKVGSSSPPPKCTICGRATANGSLACSCAIGSGSR